uniref:Cyclin-like domain-containing protein n=1 Tax=Panagrolaimus sp. ES5 TaxID=591445 RepID=A0AC34FZC0_9BILA
MLKPGFRNTTSNFIPAKPVQSGTTLSTSPAHASQTTPKVEKPIAPYPFPSNFIFSEDEIKNSPSFRKHKISADEEIILRRVGTCFIKQLTSRINKKIVVKQKQISARATCMAMVYFHRFYMYHSFTTFLPIEMATTCLFLASKAEDCPKSINVFSDYYYRLTHNGEKLQEHEFEDVNPMIEAYEIRLLQTLAFEFRIELPHIAVINAPFHSQSDYLKKIAWRFSTDMLSFTTLCLQYDEKVLAAAAFYAAGAYLDIDVTIFIYSLSTA